MCLQCLQAQDFLNLLVCPIVVPSLISHQCPIIRSPQACGHPIVFQQDLPWQMIRCSQWQIHRLGNPGCGNEVCVAAGLWGSETVEMNTLNGPQKSVIRCYKML